MPKTPLNRKVRGELSPQFFDRLAVAHNWQSPDCSPYRAHICARMEIPVGNRGILKPL